MGYLPSLPIHGNPTRVTASVQLKGSAGRLWAVLLEGGTTASSIDFKNALTDTGDILMGVTAPFTDTDASSQGTVFVDFTPIGGIEFDTGIYGVLAGTDAIAYVWSS